MQVKLIRELQSKPADEESNKGKVKDQGVCDDQSEVKERIR